MAKTNTEYKSTVVFKEKLAEYKKLIDDDIAVYSKDVRKSTLQQYGANARLEIDAFLSILGRGGKRIRGSLVILGYEMSGGKDLKMIIQVARAIEMLHAYILIIDDIQDRSVIRRGGPTAHILLADYHRQHQLADKPEHFGISIALNSALAGAHAAQMILANLDAKQELRLNVLSIVNRTMMVTAHGQTGDIMNEVAAEVSVDDVERVMEWKTAHYTFLNPLHVGMVLAGADCHATDAITPYAMHAGKAFQITDDILGIFGSEHTSGKSPMDDIREGKRTILTIYGLDHADSLDLRKIARSQGKSARVGSGLAEGEVAIATSIEDRPLPAEVSWSGDGGALRKSSASNKNFLIQMLGNQNLTQTEFKRCKDILVETGALLNAQNQAKQHVVAALQELDKEKTRWSSDGTHFLRGLVQYLLERQA